MKKDARIYVAGHRGMVGSALVRRLRAGGYTHLMLRTHGELDLLEQVAVREFMQQERPDYVFIAAARVGGIHANNTLRADFLYENLVIETNLIRAAHDAGVERLMFLGSSCIYPRACPQPIVAAVDGVCAGAGAILAMASDLRLGTARARVAFLFTRVGLAGCDMGACAILPRIIGQGRASELLFTGRSMDGAEAERWGFFNRLCAPEVILADAMALAHSLAAGPTFAHAMTKNMLHQEWSMTIEQAIEAEAQAQALCMATGDFRRAYEAFAAKRTPVFEGT